MIQKMNEQSLSDWVTDRERLGDMQDGIKRILIGEVELISWS